MRYQDVIKFPGRSADGFNCCEYVFLFTGHSGIHQCEVLISKEVSIRSSPGDEINMVEYLLRFFPNYKVIGAGYTPVRAVIDLAASFIDRPKACFALVVTHAGLAGMYFGTPEEAWQTAANLSAQKHIVYVDKPFRRVLSVMPEMYDDLWTAAKGMYKMEPAVADGG